MYEKSHEVGYMALSILIIITLIVLWALYGYINS